MRERREMSGFRKAIGPVALLALLAGGLAACGSGDQTTTRTPPPPAPVSASTADHLATLSERIATELDAGQTCDAAYAADQLKEAVNHADLSAALRPGVEEVATRLVDEVNCPPPPPPPEPVKPKHGRGDENQQGNQKHATPPGHGGKLPPGHAKLQGE